MIERIFTSEYREGFYAMIRQEQNEAVLRLEIATLRASIANILQAGGNALHAVFVGGDEPKWKHPCQREHLIELSDMLDAIHQQLATSEVSA
jgi:hypothetical protein